MSVLAARARPGRAAARAALPARGPPRGSPRPRLRPRQVPAVFHSASALLLALLDALAGGGRDVAGAAEQALPVLIERLADSNARLRDGARDAILALARNREAGLRCPAGNGALLRPVKSQTAWRPVLTTLQLLQARARGRRRAGGRSAGAAPRTRANPCARLQPAPGDAVPRGILYP